MPPFRDRPDAGRKLLPLLTKLIFGEPVYIAAIPNGGVPVAIPIARHFQMPLYVIIARKAQYPWTTESGFGAVTADGVTVLNEPALARTSMTREAIRTQVGKARAEVSAREQVFAPFLLPESLTGATVVVVDDGLASGITTRAAIRSLHRREVSKVYVAVPTAHESSIRQVESESLNERNFLVMVICPHIVGGWSFAVANAYENWYDETTRAVIEILQHHNAEHPTRSMEHGIGQ